jgi:hypothetical protein
MTLGVDEFKSKLTGGGARPNLFQVTATFPAVAPTAPVVETSFMCKAAALPASTIGNIPVAFRGRELQIAGDRTFEPWTITVINDTDFVVRDAFEGWMNGINGHAENSGATNPDDYKSDMTISQLDKQGIPIKTYIFRGTFPSSVSSIDVSWDETDSIEEFTVELQVDYWTARTTS